MSYKKPYLLSVALLLAAIIVVRAQSYSDFGSSGPIGLQNAAITYVPGTTAVNLWDGDFVVDANGFVSGSGILTSFANRQNRSTNTPFTILNVSRATSIQTSTQTSTNYTDEIGSFEISTKTTSTADFNATAQIGSGRRAPTAQFKGIITAVKTAFNSTYIYDTGNGYATNYGIGTNYYTQINGVVFGPSTQAGYFWAFAQTNN
jgi:hypothetical protein